MPATREAQWAPGNDTKEPLTEVKVANDLTTASLGSTQSIASGSPATEIDASKAQNPTG